MTIEAVETPTRAEGTAQQAASARHYTMMLASRLSIAALAQDPQDAEKLDEDAAANVLKSLAWITSDNCEAAGALAHWLDSTARPGSDDLAEALRQIEADLKPIAHELARIYRRLAAVPDPAGATHRGRGGCRLRRCPMNAGLTDDVPSGL